MNEPWSLEEETCPASLQPVQLPWNEIQIRTCTWYETSATTTDCVTTEKLKPIHVQSRELTQHNRYIPDMYITSKNIETWSSPTIPLTQKSWPLNSGFLLRTQYTPAKNRFIQPCIGGKKQHSLHYSVLLCGQMFAQKGSHTWTQKDHDDGEKRRVEQRRIRDVDWYDIWNKTNPSNHMLVSW